MSATKLSSIRPVPKAPPQTPWEYLDLDYVGPILKAREWEGDVTFDDFGRLNMLAADLRTDIDYLETLAGNLDEVISMMLSDVRNKAVAESSITPETVMPDAR